MTKKVQLHVDFDYTARLVREQMESRSDLGEVHLLRLEAKLNQLELLLVRRVLLHEGRQNVASARGDRHRRLLLQEAELVRLLRQGERLLEEVQSVVVVQDP